jgi:hypothetical protein
VDRNFVSNLFAEKTVRAMELFLRAEEYLLKFIPFLQEQKNDPDFKNRTGCYLGIADKATGDLLIFGMVGTPTPEKRKKYCAFAQEKGDRKHKHPEHLTSHESRNPDNNEFGGAIDTDNFTIMTSGFPEKADTLFSTSIGSKDIKDKNTINLILKLGEAEELAEKFVKKYGTLFI